MKDSVAKLLNSCRFDLVGEQRTRDMGRQTRTRLVSNSTMEGCQHNKRYPPLTTIDQLEYVTLYLHNYKG